jgi:hypothetical protein
LHPELTHCHSVFALKTDPCINLLTQQLATVLNTPVVYLYCAGDDLAEILLQISSASYERIREIKLALNEPS